MGETNREGCVRTADSREGGDGGENSTRVTPKWCKCNFSEDRVQMKQVKKKCCGQHVRISLNNDFVTVHLDTEVVRIAVNNRSGVTTRPPDHNNKTLRHAAYKQFVLWYHGYLSRNHRVVIPSCVVWHIRRE